jgi:CelD/BcsL family acetyltransferase involved in cellulose biosynthesis
LNRLSPAGLRVTTVTTDAGFGSLKAAWNVVASRSAAPSIFLSHEWFDAAWAWRRLNSTLLLHVVRRGESVIGILPLIRAHGPSNRARRLELLTVPDTQLSDLIAACGDLAQVAEALAVELSSRRDWDVLDLSYLSAQSGSILAFCPAVAKRGLRPSESDAGLNRFISLNGTWVDYYSKRSRRLKKANNLAANRLKKAGNVRVEWLRPDTCDDSQLGRAVDTAIDISGCSWKRLTGNSLDQPGPQAFILRLSEAARELGWLSIWLMHLDGRPVAMEYQLIDGINVHALRSDFAEGLEEISPGSYLFRHLLQSCYGQGFDRYYMGPGDNSYKLRWTDQGEPLRRVIVYNRTLRGRLAWLREAVVKPVLRAARDRISSARNTASKDALADGSSGQ